jgi:hypothetical protein
MTQHTDHSDLINWLSEHPELLEKLHRMREIEHDEGNGDIERIELEILELVKSIGAQSFGRCVQAKESKAFEEEKAKAGGRIHGKKTDIFQLAGNHPDQRAGVAPKHFHLLIEEFAF